MQVPGGHLTFTEKLIPGLIEYITYETTRYNYDKTIMNTQGLPVYQWETDQLRINE